MRIALACDHLILRNDSTQILDLMCEIFPEAPIFAYAHRPGKVLGHIEMRKVTSSYLSHFVDSERSFTNWKFLTPTLKNTLQIPPETDCLVSLSTGVGHG